MLYRNEELLEGFLSGRRFCLRTRESYGVAVRSFSNLVRAPLDRTGKAELEEWYRQVSSRGLAASTIDVYSSRLRNVLEYALIGRGMSSGKAKAMATIALEGVPIADLRRETKRLCSWQDKLILQEELDALRMTPRLPRTRAFVDALYESACRKGELIGLRMRDMTHRDRYTELRVYGKTGLRTLPLVRSVPRLKAWLEVHPDPRPGAPLFATIVRGEVRRMDRRTPNRLLIDLCARARLRHITPHMLRHTRLTELARAGIGEYQLKSFAGWTPDSKMAARYIHLSGRAHIPAILRVDGDALDEERSACVRAAGRLFREGRVDEAGFREILSRLKIVGDRADLLVLRYKLEAMSADGDEEDPQVNAILEIGVMS